MECNKENIYSENNHSNIHIKLDDIFKYIILNKNNNIKMPSVILYDGKYYVIKFQLSIEDNLVLNYINGIILSKISKNCLNINCDLFSSIKIIKKRINKYRYTMKLDLRNLYYLIDLEKMLNEFDFLHKKVLDFLKKIYLDTKYIIDSSFLDKQYIINYKELFHGISSSIYILSYFITKVFEYLNIDNYNSYLDECVIFSNSLKELEEIKEKLYIILYNFGYDKSIQDIIEIYNIDDTITLLDLPIKLNINNKNDVDNFIRILNSDMPFTSIFLDCDNQYKDYFNNVYKNEMLYMLI